MPKIAVTGCDLEVCFLAREEFYRTTNRHYEKPNFTAEYSFDDYISEKRDTEGLLRDALSRQ